MSAVVGQEKFDPTLYNEDLAPIPEERRNWSWVNYSTVWMGMVHNVVAYTTAAGLVGAGMSPWQAIGTVAIANVVLIIAMWINSIAGAKYGLPFPVLIRAAFGYKGAQIPVIIRGFVAIFWFAVQTYLGSLAVGLVLGAVIPGWSSLDFSILGMGLNGWISFLVFWALHAYVILHGMERIKFFELWARPLVIVAGMALEAISQIPEQDDDAPEAGEAEVVLGPPLVADHQPPEVRKPREQPLDLPAPLVAPELAPVLGLPLLAVPPVRGDHLYARFSEGRVQRVGVVGPVADQPLGPLIEEARGQGLLYEGDLVRRSARRANGERKTRAVCQRHELRALAPLGLSHLPPPFFAPAKVPSMKHSERSRPPRSLRSSARARRISSSTPSSFHLWKRRWQVW